MELEFKLFQKEKKKNIESLDQELLNFCIKFNEDHHLYCSEKEEAYSFMKALTSSVYGLHKFKTVNYNRYIENNLLNWYFSSTHSDEDNLNNGINLLYYLFLNIQVKNKGFNERRDLLLQEALNFILSENKNLFELEQINEVDSKDLKFYTHNKINAVVDFSFFPISDFKEEFIFIRIVQVGEVCFKLINSKIKKIISDINNDIYNKQYLKEIIFLTDVLHISARILKTMSPDHFLEFRALTLNASAIQSYIYQEMDILMLGMNPLKIPFYEKIPELKKLCEIYDTTTVNLKSLVKNDKILDESFCSMLGEFNKKMLKWKAIHIGLAMSYIPKKAEGTGTKEGIDYLSKVLKDSIFE
ncbi:tryptophan 2,3-dioxygenase family protein [Chryseobacterium potabilaquae]|uniref:Tryptophan 2,3-dioxygenase n=1 Tax=Chryseobacterium potabilaquae TaxID=2675057 RepID=A0A6N4X033_9FLAO|nr:tryptophan 2,3-dioxygenase family protein [Chryseobacterium potabilaquae]CAA7194098.1 Tryptophan 2,3-dioxygenase [Chryseobacterium potabilaquae]